MPAFLSFQLQTTFLENGTSCLQFLFLNYNNEFQSYNGYNSHNNGYGGHSAGYAGHGGWGAGDRMSSLGGGLRSVDWATTKLSVFEKNFYAEDQRVSARNDKDIEDFRRTKEIKACAFFFFYADGWILMLF